MARPRGFTDQKRVWACIPLRHRAGLAGWRGAAPVDMAALADVVVAFSTLAIELGDALDAVEANPVIASADGVVAVDALLVVRGRVGE